MPTKKWYSSLILAICLIVFGCGGGEAEMSASEQNFGVISTGPVAALPDGIAPMAPVFRYQLGFKIPPEISSGLLAMIQSEIQTPGRELKTGVAVNYTPGIFVIRANKTSQWQFIEESKVMIATNGDHLIAQSKGEPEVAYQGQKINFYETKKGEVVKGQFTINYYLIGQGENQFKIKIKNKLMVQAGLAPQYIVYNDQFYLGYKGEYWVNGPLPKMKELNQLKLTFVDQGTNYGYEEEVLVEFPGKIMEVISSPTDPMPDLSNSGQGETFNQMLE